MLARTVSGWPIEGAGVGLTRRRSVVTVGPGGRDGARMFARNGIRNESLSCG